MFYDACMNLVIDLVSAIIPPLSLIASCKARVPEYSDPSSNR